MIKVQEIIASLVEIIFLMYTYNDSRYDKFISMLGYDYQKIINPYKYVLEKDFLDTLSQCFWRYLDDHLDNSEEFKKTFIAKNDFLTSLNILNYVLLITAQISFDIDFTGIDYSEWNTKKKVERLFQSKPNKYMPLPRFKALMKNNFSNYKNNECEEKIIFYVPDKIELCNYRNDLLYGNVLNGMMLEIYEDENVKSREYFKKKLYEQYDVNVIFKYNVEHFSKNAFLYSMPFLLNKENLIKVFGYNIYAHVYDCNIVEMQGNMSDFYGLSFIHIHVGTGVSNMYRYYIGISDILNNMKFLHLENRKLNKNVNQFLEIRLFIDDVDEFLKYIVRFTGKLLFTGYERTEHLLEEECINTRKEPIFINSAKSLGSAKIFMQKYFYGSYMEIKKGKYYDIVIMKKNNKIAFELTLPGIDKVITEFKKEFDFAMGITVLNETSENLTDEELKAVCLYSDFLYKLNTRLLW